MQVCKRLQKYVEILTVLLYNKGRVWKGGPSLNHFAYTPRRSPRRAKLSRWHKFVLLVGYAALIYGFLRGAVYVLVLLGGGA